jgi:Starch-binding associating with outer membrane
MKKATFKFILFASALSIGIAGCKRELDINKNPNTVTESNITPALILPNALHNVGVQTANGYGWLSNWIGHWSPSGSYNPNTEESTYNITSSFQETKWANVYNALFDLDVIENKSIASEDTFYRAIAMTMKAHLFQNLVDLYGNVPYKQAFKSLEFPSPAYDKAEEIYADLQLKLDTAISLMETAPIGDAEAHVDIVFGGDADLWIKLANTLKLRMLIRLSEINPNPTAEIAKIVAKGGVLLAGETAAANPGYLNDEDKQSPFFGIYGLTPSGNQANEYYRANNYIITILKNNNDARLGRFFKPVKDPASPPTYIGTVYGSDPDVAFNGDRTSNIGLGLVRSFDQDQWIVTSVESLFLRAEAVARGWLAGDAKAAYEAAVRESFVWLAVPSATTEANNYLLNASANWANAGTTTDSKAKFILAQKYIALTGINPLEAWSDWRRLGVPTNIPLSVNPARGTRTIPVRLIYPAAEYAVNSANVQSQGNIDAYAKIFWDK